MPKLKTLIKSLDEVAKELQGLYEKTDDGFVLSVEDDEFKLRIGEFRTNNTRLEQEKRDLVAKLERYKDVDPEKYRKALDALQKIEGDEERKLIEGGKLEEVISRRTGAMKTDYERQLADARKRGEGLEKESLQVKTELGLLRRSNALQATLNDPKFKLRLAPGALPDVEERVAKVYHINEALQLVPMERSAEDGQLRTKYGKDSKPLAMTEFLTELSTAAPHLFEGGGGGGAGGGKGGGPGGEIEITSPLDFGRHAKEIAEGKVTVR